GRRSIRNERRKMDRSFVIAQISDLHLDGSGRLLATVEALAGAIREKMADFADVPDRILLITGDLVNDPTPRALDESLAVIAVFRPSEQRRRGPPWVSGTRRLGRAGGKSGARAGDAPSSAAAGDRRGKAVSRRSGRAADVSRRARDLSRSGHLAQRRSGPARTP